MNRRHFLAAVGLAALPGSAAAVSTPLAPHVMEARDQILRRGRLGKVSLLEVTCHGDRAAGIRLFGEAVQMLELGGQETHEPQGRTIARAESATFYYPGSLIAWSCHSTDAQQPVPPVAVFYGDWGTLRLSASGYSFAAAPAVGANSGLRFT